MRKRGWLIITAYDPFFVKSVPEEETNSTEMINNEEATETIFEEEIVMGVVQEEASGTGTVTQKITGRASGKTYYVRIRTYKTMSETNYYSGRSMAKAVKTK